MNSLKLEKLIPPCVVCVSWFAFLSQAQSAPETALPNANTADGDRALFSITTGVGNSGFGSFALFSNTTANYNTAVGAGALDLNNGEANTAVGVAALLFNTVGHGNTATGVDALYSNTIGVQNTANGAFALMMNTIGNQNTAVGNQALGTIPNGTGNIAIGNQAGLSLVTGSNNIDIGNLGVAVESNTIRIGDPAIHGAIFLAGIGEMSPTPPNRAVLVEPVTGQLGSADISSFGVVTTSPENTAVGDQALVSNTGGSDTAAGFQALMSNTNGGRNTAIGAHALANNIGNISGNGSFNDAVGTFALNHNVSGFTNNAMGDSALELNEFAAENTAIGDLALRNNDATGAGSANFNTAVGASAMLNNVDGSSNTVVGAAAGPNVVAGFNNTYIGQFVGDNNGTPIDDEDSTIRIADASIDGIGSLQCYIGGIFNNPQPVGGSVVVVTLDLDNDHLGYDAGLGRSDSPARERYRSTPERRLRPQPRHPAALNSNVDRVEKLEATIAKQQKEIETLRSELKEQAKIFTIQLKEQATQIQKVSAGLEVSKAAQKTVLNNQQRSRADEGMESDR